MLAHVDYPYSEQVETAMRRYLADNPKGKHGQHRYAVEQFGLDKDVIKERFADYCRDFDLS